ncbi:putative Glycosyl transferases group 1 [Leptolyngbya sp. NIES-3755]|nr:putative Glycosyl transferases group 1 [Leptolyngbya sp. NIES-3755]
MKIVQLITQMEAGGAQRVAVLLAEALRADGDEVETCFFYLKRPSHTDLPNIKVFCPHQPSALDSVRILCRFWRYLRKTKPDVLITHTHYANILGQIIAYFCGVPARLAVQHNPVSVYPKLARSSDRFLGSTQVYSCNVAVSGAVVDSVTHYPRSYRKKIVKIHNGIPPLQVTASNDRVRAEWGLPLEVPLLINVGRFAEQKNQQTLIEMLPFIPNAHLILVGEGELREQLIQQTRTLELEDRVHFLGELKPDQVMQLMSIATIFVFPSIFEAMPMAVIEAMRLGLPLVTSDIPALREVIGDAGRFASAHDVKRLVQVVQEILDSPTLQHRMRHESLQRSELFSLQKMVEAYKHLFA